ncbi:MAG: ComF family protein [Rickettsiales bacterium]|nr:ComF family protein [Rickettsiales bacterium]
MKILKSFLKIIFPSHCLACEKIISADGLFCADCWPKLQFISEPKCAICAYPFEFQGLSLLCAKCLTKKPSFDKSVAIFRYNHVIRKIISSLKYRDQTFVAKKFARLLFDKAKNEIAACDLIIPVPLHVKRLRKRKFNQAILLAKNLLKFAPKKTFYPDFLIRTKHTKPQVELKKKDRENNLKNVFEVNEKYRETVRGKKIILIDDVTTTGATLENCAKVLKKCGAKEVVVLVVAKTALGGS